MCWREKNRFGTFPTTQIIVIISHIWQLLEIPHTKLICIRSDLEFVQFFSVACLGKISVNWLNIATASGGDVTQANKKPTEKLKRKSCGMR